MIIEEKKQKNIFFFYFNWVNDFFRAASIQAFTYHYLQTFCILGVFHSIYILTEVTGCPIKDS